MIRVIIFAFSIVVLGVSMHHFTERLDNQVHLTGAISLDVYLTNNACVEALEHVDALQSEHANALLVSNCLHSKAFRSSEVQWNSPLVLPPQIFQVSGHQMEQELTTWLQRKSDSKEFIPPEQFQVLRLLEQPDVEASLNLTQFLCANRDLLIKLPKPVPSLSWQRNQYALLNQCIEDHRDYRRSGMDDAMFEYSKGASLLKAFAHTVPARRHFEDVLRTNPH